MKKYIMAAAIAVCSLFSANASTSWFTVNTTDGNELEFLFDMQPEITFQENDMIVTTVDDEVLTIPMSDVVNITFATTGVETVKDVNPGVELTKEALTVRNLKANARVSIFDLNGRMVASAKTDNNGFVTISLGNLGAGVYVASMPGYNFKFIHR